jgi:hypothetical protein
MEYDGCTFLKEVRFALQLFKAKEITWQSFDLAYQKLTSLVPDIPKEDPSIFLGALKDLNQPLKESVSYSSFFIINLYRIDFI